MGSHSPVRSGSPHGRHVPDVADDRLRLVMYHPVTREASVKVGSGLGLRKFHPATLQLRGLALVVSEDEVINLEDAVVTCGSREDLKVKALEGELLCRIKFNTVVERDEWFRELTQKHDTPSLATFEVLVPIGRGGMGKVFVVRDRRSGERLAMKVLRKEAFEDSNKALRRALDERLILELTIGCPFVVQLRDAFQTKSNLYMIMDFYPGGDLHDYLQQKEFSIDERIVRRFTAEIVLALEHIHALGVVYRDLKPENVLLDEHGHVKLADFGLAKVLAGGKLGRTNSFCGTKRFMSPEVFLRRSYGVSADLWSLGILILTLLSGKAPNFYPEAFDAAELDFLCSASAAVRDLVVKLLKPEAERIGLEEVKRHEWFAGVSFSRVLAEADVDAGSLCSAGSSEDDAPNAPDKASPAVWEDWELRLMAEGKFLHSKVYELKNLSISDDEQLQSARASHRHFDARGRLNSGLRRVLGGRGSAPNLIPGYLFSSGSAKNLLAAANASHDGDLLHNNTSRLV